MPCWRAPSRASCVRPSWVIWCSWPGLSGETPDTLTALGLAGAGMTLVQPEALSDIGFQLSFAGTLGLIVIGPRLGVVLTERARLPRWSAELLATTAAASLMVTPIIAHSFDRFQLMAVPANLLALAAPAATWPPARRSLSGRPPGGRQPTSSDGLPGCRSNT